MNSKLLNHFEGRRELAAIVHTLTDKYDTNVLKLLCVMDYWLDKSEMYEKITKVPKLLPKLLQLHSVESFKYFSYRLPDEAMRAQVGEKLLLCGRCDLVAPYLIVLEHLAISHNLHVNVNVCMWCKKREFRAHANLDECYTNYVAKQLCGNTTYSDIIVDFYEMLRKLAKELKVNVIHRKTYKNAYGHTKRKEILSNDYDIDPNIIYYTPKHRPHKGFDINVLEKLFIEAVKHFSIDLKVNETLVSTSAILNSTNMAQTTSTTIVRAPATSTSTLNLRPLSITLNINPFQVITGAIAENVENQRTESLPITTHMQMPSASNLVSELMFGTFIGSILKNIRDETLRNSAESEIRSIVHKYVLMDFNRQLDS